MKKLLKTTLLIAAVAVLTVSCTKRENDDSNVPSNGRTYVEFSSNIVSMDPIGKAIGETWGENDDIGIYMFEEASLNVVENTENVPYTTVSGGQTGQFSPKGRVIFFPDNGSKVRFMAYYPYTSAVSSNIYKVNVSNQAVQSNIDLLYSFDKEAAYDKKTPNKKVPLTFDHKLTKVIVNVKAGTGLEDADLDNLDIHFFGLNTNVDFDLIDGSFSNYSGDANIIPASIDPKQGYHKGYEAILLPTTEIPATGKIIFDLSNGSLFSWNFNRALNSGSKYTFNVTINRSGIVVEATINDWDHIAEDDIIAE